MIFDFHFENNNMSNSLILSSLRNYYVSKNHKIRAKDVKIILTNQTILDSFSQEWL